MRRFASILLIISISAFWISQSPEPVQGQFATNTPAGDGPAPVTVAPTDSPSATPDEPDEDAADNSADDDVLAPINFATNTPAGPTSTPTGTPTPTNTPTNTPPPTATPTNTPAPSPTPNGPFIYPEGTNPLTGLPYPDDEALARRNLIVKISNYPPVVRPQHGVNMADVVYEYEAEGGVTRFAGIYRSQSPERVGSIRSARLLDMELVTMYRALLAYSGTSEPIQQLLLSEDFFNFQILSPLVGHGCEDTGFCRDAELRAQGVDFEHTLFGSTDLMWSTATRQGTNTGYQARGFAFAEENVNPDGAIANDVFIDWYGQTDARWQYDEATGRYLRYTDGVAHYDALDGDQLWADNLIIIEVPHEERPDLFPPGATYASLEIQLWDQGRSIVMRDGEAYYGFWRRRNFDPGSALQVLYGDNTPIFLKPGRTWVSVVRGFGSVTVSEDREILPTVTPTPQSVG